MPCCWSTLSSHRSSVLRQGLALVYCRASLTVGARTQVPMCEVLWKSWMKLLLEPSQPSLLWSQIVLKVLGMSVWEYISDGFNLFDVAIVGISLVDIIVSSTGQLNSLRTLRVLRALRVLRLLRLFKSLKSLRKISDVLMQVRCAPRYHDPTSFKLFSDASPSNRPLQSMSSFLSIAMLLFVFIFVYTVVGLHAFGSTPINGIQAPVTFRTFALSLTTVFQASRRPGTLAFLDYSCFLDTSGNCWIFAAVRQRECRF